MYGSGQMGGMVPAFSIAPNPSSGLVRIDVPSAPEFVARLRITDALGRSVMDDEMRDRSRILRIAGARGLYLMAVESAHGRSTRILVLE
jgi:hypothetical protein